MFEYAMSDGEGTLIDYGWCVDMDVVRYIAKEAVENLWTLIFAPCGDDCETGE